MDTRHRQPESTSGGSVDRTFDTWGRTLTQTDGAGNTATETYDSAGRVKTLNDGKGTYTYTYDGTDSNGKTERRGFVTKLDVGLASGPDEFTAAYDANGDTTQLRYPNDVVQDNAYDIVGNQATQTYSRNGTKFLSETAYVDIQGRTRVDLTTGSSKAYAYDGRNRLTTVQDYTGGPCTTRTYTYSLDSDRTSLATSPWAPDGSCSTSSPTTKTSTFATDDKITNTGYTYDAFGRTRTIPSGDTDQSGGGALTATYFANDMVAHLSQNTPTTTSPLAEKTYALDPLQRIANTTATTGGVDLRKTTNHYSDVSDSPAWTADQTRPDGTSSWTSSWTRDVAGIDGSLGIIQNSDGTSRIQLTNMHGDIVSTMANTTSTSAALENYSESAEYGNAEPLYPSLPQQYGWLGSVQRSTDSVGGLTLMGARLYNSATGTFLSRDPVPGGNDNTYVYPADPINQFDTSGMYRYGPWHHLKTKVRTFDVKSYKVKGPKKVKIPGLGVIKLWAKMNIKIKVTWKVYTSTKYRYFYKGSSSQREGVEYRYEDVIYQRTRVYTWYIFKWIDTGFQYLSTEKYGFTQWYLHL